MPIVAVVPAPKSTVVRAVCCVVMPQAVVLRVQSANLRDLRCFVCLTPTNAPMLLAQRPASVEATRFAKIAAAKKRVRSIRIAQQVLYVRIRLASKRNPRISASLATPISLVWQGRSVKALPRGRSARWLVEQEQEASRTGRLVRRVRRVQREPLASTTSV